MSLKVIFEKLYPSYSKKLWKYILDESVNLFLQMIFISSIKYNPNEAPQLIQKILKDKQGMEDLYKSILSTKDIESAMGRLMSLVQAYQEPKENIASHLFKLKNIMGKQYNENCTVVTGLTRNVSLG
jgi:hypothetical protein